MTVMEMLERALDEEYEFDSTQYRLPKKVENLLADLRDQIDPNDLTEIGLETDPHMTLLYGITGGEESKKKVVDLLKEATPANATTAGIEIFKPAGGEYEVIVVKVKGADLHDLHNRLKKNLPNKQTFPEYKPHMTLAFVKAGMGNKYQDLPVPELNFSLSEVEYSPRTGERTTMRIGK